MGGDFSLLQFALGIVSGAFLLWLGYRLNKRMEWDRVKQDFIKDLAHFFAKDVNKDREGFMEESKGISFRLEHYLGADVSGEFKKLSEKLSHIADERKGDQPSVTETSPRWDLDSEVKKFTANLGRKKVVVGRYILYAVGAAIVVCGAVYLYSVFVPQPPPVYRTTDKEDRFSRVMACLQLKDYGFLKKGYLSYELAQIVAFNVSEDTSADLSVLHLSDALDSAIGTNSNAMFCCNVVEIAGNLGIMKREQPIGLQEVIIPKIESILSSQYGDRYRYVDELCKVKLSILAGGRRRQLKEIVNQIDAGKRTSFYELEIFEKPDYWLPFVISQTNEIGEARFYAAFLLQRVIKKKTKGLVTRIDYLIEQEKKLGRDADVIRSLEEARTWLLTK